MIYIKKINFKTLMIFCINKRLRQALKLNIKTPFLGRASLLIFQK